MWVFTARETGVGPSPPRRTLFRQLRIQVCGVLDSLRAHQMPGLPGGQKGRGIGSGTSSTQAGPGSGQAVLGVSGKSGHPATECDSRAGSLQGQSGL